MNFKTIARWVGWGILVGATCYALYRFANEFKTEYTEPEIQTAE